ncbi:quinol:cytochrome C oxidoreductase [Candidatus Marinamargulisbacteria bacterium SCGC AG-333-B06]|nr:quinol:cytochrome C oxidoreductase [Candidatus Marinamargulisbacteria bacterium SCGC AG-333-B06]
MRQVLIVMCLFFCLVGCRGWRSEKPPIHLNPNLDFQASTRAQENPHLRPDHTIPWGMESDISYPEHRDAVIKQANPSFYTGKDKQGVWINTVPIDVTNASLKRGQERFEIYCSMCHGKDGSGNGIVMEYGWFKPKPYWDQAIVSYKDGELFDIITNGIRTMPSYSQQIKESDRWAIVAYIRALQVSNKMNYRDVPIEYQQKLKSL